jgi:carbamoyl-phosphate synthase small subunit
MKAKLTLEDKTVIEAESFGAENSVTGEMVFSTGMMGYPESLTDPSYLGQILIATYPIVGSYGVPDKAYWESGKIQATAFIVSQYIDTPSHFQSKRTLGQWLKDEGIPGLIISDTRFLTEKLRDKGSMLGKIEFGSKKIEFHDPNTDNLVAQVSTKKVLNNKGNPKGKWYGKTIVLIDCGAKKNITNCLVERGLNVITIPWNMNPFQEKLKFDCLLISNGPGDPKLADKTIATIEESLKRKFPTLGICLGNQLLALAAGGDTSKLKFGHRSQNQPCVRDGSSDCFITTQNHGFHVNKIPDGFKAWFTNANDNTNEGIIHKTYPFMSVQFHPEATPGPQDTEWIFDFFLERTFK